MISQLFNQEVFKIISLFSLSPGSSFSRNEIKNKTKLNNVPLDNGLAKLCSAGILKREKKRYSINFENEYSKKLIEICSKQYKQLKELPFDVYLLLSDFVTAMSRIRDVQIYLFGSYSKLIYKEDSDIDIAIISPNELNVEYVKKTVRKLEKKYKKKVETHHFTKKEFYKNKREPLIKDIITNGTKLMN